MTTILVEREIAHCPDELLQLAKDFAEKLSKENPVTFDWCGRRASIAGIGVSGYFEVAEKHVEISLELGFLLSGFASHIEEQIHQYLDEMASV